MSLSEQNRALIQRDLGQSYWEPNDGYVWLAAATEGDLNRLLDAARAEGAGWRCFQCDAVFTDEREAVGHFGKWSHHSPACMAGESFLGLKTAYNELEADFDAMKLRAEGIAALQQAGEPISRENLEAELRETIGLYVREAVTRMFSEENATYRCARQIAGMLQPGYYLHRKLFSSPLPQQTALVEEGVEKIMAPHEPAACGASAPSEPPRSNREKIESVLNDALRLQVDTLIGEVLTLVPQGYVGWDYHGRHWTDQISKRAADAVLAENEEHLRLAMNGVKAALPILYTLRDRQQNVETWGLRGRIAALEAALRFAHPAELDISGAQRSELTRSAQDEPISTPPPPTDGEVK